MKKPLWKRGWIWALILIVIFARIGKDSTERKQQEQLQRGLDISAEQLDSDESEELRYVIEKQSDKEKIDITPYFKDVVEGAQVNQTSTGSTVNIQIKTDISYETQPENWEEIIEILLAAHNSVPPDQAATSRIEAADGTVLLSVAGGKVLYDYFVGVEEPQHREIKAGLDDIDFDTGVHYESSGEKAYVLNTNTMKFHLPGCSSVKNISAENRSDVTADRDDLIAQGYDPCGKCHP